MVDGRREKKNPKRGVEPEQVQNTVVVSVVKMAAQQQQQQ